MEELLKNELRALAITTREQLRLTQKEMADKLEMSESSYSDIETGKYMCGTLTVVLLLAELENSYDYLHRLCDKFHALYEKEMQTV